MVPKSLRERLGFAAGAELELSAVDGHLEIAVPSRVRLDSEDRHRPRFVAETDVRLDAAAVRELMERGRR